MLSPSTCEARVRCDERAVFRMRFDGLSERIAMCPRHADESRNWALETPGSRMVTFSIIPESQSA